METIRKVIVCEVKEVADRTLEFVGSTEDQDRDGEVIIAAGWDLKNYKKNPVFMFAHNYSQPPIGRATRVWKSDGQLKFNIEFAKEEDYPFADTVYRLYKGGFMKATSVGFIPKSWEDGDGEKAPKRTYNKQELLELSAVPVPSNPNALVQAQEDGVITIKEFNVLTEETTVDTTSTTTTNDCTTIDDGNGDTAVPTEKIATQAEVKDELDYLKNIIGAVGLNTEALGYAWELMREVMRLTGNDIPEDILEKIGAVLNQKNKDRLNQIQDLAQAILDSAETESIDEPETKVDKEAIAKLVKNEINRLQGKI